MTLQKLSVGSSFLIVFTVFPLTMEAPVNKRKSLISIYLCHGQDMVGVRSPHHEIYPCFHQGRSRLFDASFFFSLPHIKSTTNQIMITADKGYIPILSHSILMLLSPILDATSPSKPPQNLSHCTWPHLASCL